MPTSSRCSWTDRLLGPPPRRPARRARDGARGAGCRRRARRVRGPRGSAGDPDRHREAEGRARLQRLRNLLADPRAVLLVDHYDDEWSSCGGCASTATPTRGADPRSSSARGAFPAYPPRRGRDVGDRAHADPVTGWAAPPGGRLTPVRSAACSSACSASARVRPTARTPRSASARLAEELGLRLDLGGRARRGAEPAGAAVSDGAGGPDPRPARVPRLRGRRHRAGAARHRDHHPPAAEPARPRQAGRHPRRAVRRASPARHRRRIPRARDDRPRRAHGRSGNPHRRPPRRHAGPLDPTRARGPPRPVRRLLGRGRSPRPVTPGGPRIVVGGHSPAAYRRAVTSGHGWYGFGLTPEQTGACLEGLRQAADQVERPPRSATSRSASPPAAASTPRRSRPSASRRPPAGRQHRRRPTPADVESRLRAAADLVLRG